MTAFTLSVQGQRPISGDLAAPRYTGYRVRFYSSGGRWCPNGMPTVMPSLNVDWVWFTEALQKLSYDINAANPYRTGKAWRSVYGSGRAYCNGNGFDDPADPRADFINHQDEDKPLPKLMRAIIAQGNFVRGRISGSELIVTPGVGAIDANLPLPTAETVLERNWYFRATTAIYVTDGSQVVSDFPQFGGGPVLVPYVLSEPARYPASWFAEWDDDHLPNPLKVGG